MNEDIVQFTVDGLVFSHEATGDEPLIRDIDLAVRLMYTRPRTIRTLIRRMIKDGKLNNIHMRCTVQRIPKLGGGLEEREVVEYWLTEAQAIKVAARSDTEKADALLDEVIRVFILARKGLLGTTVAPAFEHVRERVDYIAQHLQGELLARARLRDNSSILAMTRSAIRAAASALHESFQKCHGALRRQFRVPSYQDLSLREVPLLMVWLQERVKGTPVAILAQQLTLWPERPALRG